MTRSTAASAALFERAHAVTPGGVNSPVRAFNAVGGTPRFIERAAGPYLFDVDGTEYVDLVGSWGPMLLGHAHPQVLAAVHAAVDRGTSYGTPTRPEVELAEAIVARTPVEKVRFVSSGTEATMSAIRLARGATGRSRVVKFSGNYHGHSDGLLADSGSGVALLDVDESGTVPGSAGVPATAVAETSIVPYNRVPVLDDTVARVIVEPIAANMGLVAPVAGFLEGLRSETRRVGALLIFDEVITGFRVARGGAQALYGVTPDLTCFGKVIGGGLNVGAFGGQGGLMDLLAPLGAVYQAGTLSGNPLATAAGLAALALLDDEAYVTLTARACRLAGDLQAAFDDAGFVARAAVAGTLIGFFMGDHVPVDYADARGTDERVYASFFHAMLERGVALAPGPYEVAFPGLAHDDEVIDDIVQAAAAAATEMVSTA